jgi:hypothetical protein
MTLPDQTLRGKAALRAFFEPIFACVAGDQVTVESLSAVDDRYILLVFSVDSVVCPGVVLEGVETFILTKGLITGQTLYTL